MLPVVVGTTIGLIGVAGMLGAAARRPRPEPIPVRVDDRRRRRR